MFYIRHSKAYDLQSRYTVNEEGKWGMCKSILVVDDDTSLQAALQNILEDENYTVDVAGDGLAALAKLEQAKPDLILLDLMMPRMDGYSFAKELQQRGWHPYIPFIVLSADISAKTKIEHMGANGYLTKPFDIDKLLNMISQLTQARQSSKTNTGAA